MDFPEMWEIRIMEAHMQGPWVVEAGRTNVDTSVGWGSVSPSAPSVLAGTRKVVAKVLCWGRQVCRRSCVFMGVPWDMFVFGCLGLQSLPMGVCVWPGRYTGPPSGVSQVIRPTGA